MTSNSSCLHVRRFLLIDPEKIPQDCIEHVDGCDACYNYQNKLLEQNSQLRSAMEVPVPEGLSDRILLQRYTKKKSTWQPWAMVASITLLLVSYLAVNTNTQQKDWALIAAQHVAKEPYALLAKDNISQQDFLNALKKWGISTKASIGKLYFLEYCDMPNGKGLHVVFSPDGKSKSTLFILPLGTKKSNIDARYGDYYASAMPVGDSSLAIVSESPQELDLATRWVNKHMTVL